MTRSEQERLPQGGPSFEPLVGALDSRRLVGWLVGWLVGEKFAELRGLGLRSRWCLGPKPNQTKPNQTKLNAYLAL